MAALKTHKENAVNLIQCGKSRHSGIQISFYLKKRNPNKKNYIGALYLGPMTKHASLVFLNLFLGPNFIQKTGKDNKKRQNYMAKAKLAGTKKATCSQASRTRSSKKENKC